MAEEFDQSRTEAPTERRREEARRQGQLAVSTDLSGALLLLAGVTALWLGAGALAGGLLDNLRLDLLRIDGGEFGVEQAQAVFMSMFGRGMEMVGYLLGFLLVVGVAAGTFQVGFQIIPDLLSPRWERLSPARGWSRLFSAAALARGLALLAKVGLMALLAVWVLKGRGAEIAGFSRVALAGSVSRAWDLTMRLALAVAASMVVIGLADYLFQRWRHEMGLFMTRQEMKEEVKREEGDPLIRARVRRLQREMSRKRMMQEVPRATVVVTNPTHLAVALRYERGAMAAPKVVAKGAGHVARKIADLARRHAIPVVERRPVAQALYRAVKVGQEIPAVFYQAIAELLAYVYRLRGAS